MKMTRNGVTKDWKPEDLDALLPRGWVPVVDAQKVLEAIVEAAPERALPKKRGK